MNSYEKNFPAGGAVSQVEAEGGGGTTLTRNRTPYNGTPGFIAPGKLDLNGSRLCVAPLRNASGFDERSAEEKLFPTSRAFGLAAVFPTPDGKTSALPP